MKVKLIILSVCCYIFVWSCTHSEKKLSGQKQSAFVAIRNQHNKTFFDSILSKDYISVSQLKYHVSNPDDFSRYSHFQGDTVYYPNSNHPIVILSMDYNGVSLEKYLLVYQNNNLKNISCLHVESDPDSDAGTDYIQLAYKVFGPTLFYTREAWYKTDSNKTTLTDKFYRINTNGQIVLLKRKPKGLVLPKFEPVDIIDPDK